MKTICLLVFLLLLTSCIGESRHYAKSELRKLFQDQKGVFEELINQWQASDLNGTLSYSRQEDESVTWNDVPVRYKWDINEATKIMGIMPSQFQYLLSAARKLQISEISTVGQKFVSEQRYVSIWF